MLIKCGITLKSPIKSKCIVVQNFPRYIPKYESSKLGHFLKVQFFNFGWKLKSLLFIQNSGFGHPKQLVSYLNELTSQNLKIDTIAS